MRFKEGERVRIREDLRASKRYGDCCVNEEMEEMAGQIVTITYAGSRIYGIKEDDDRWRWSDAMFESLAKPTKEELFKMPLGTIIKTDKENYNIFVKVGENDFCNDDVDHIEDNDVNDDLSLEYFGNKIIEIQEPTYNTIYRADKEVKEMTIAEIEKELGYPIKVIKENIKD